MRLYQTVQPQGQQRREPGGGTYCSRVMQWFSTLQAVQEGAEKQLSRDQGCLPVHGGWRVGLQPLKLPIRNLLDASIVGVFI